MKNLPKLIDAICEAFSDGLQGQRWAPMVGADGRIYTYCNEATNYICKAMGFDGFDKPKTASPDDAFFANEMYDAMDKSQEEWKRVIATEAQDLANQGSLVIAAWRNPIGGPGHVAVVRPGVLDYSNSWKSYAPKIMNIGRENFIHKKASFAFREIPHFYVWKESL